MSWRHGGEHDGLPTPFLPLPFPEITPVAPPNDEVRQAVLAAADRVGDRDPYWVHAELDRADVSLEVVCGVLGGL